MRVGISWEPGSDRGAATAWKFALSEATTADRLGFDSVWITESRDSDGCPSPGVLLTFLSRRAKTAQLRARREVSSVNPVRLAEEIAVLDVFSRGRAGLAFTPASTQGLPAAMVHETIDFVTTAWASDEFRYRGEFVRFPSHTGDDAPEGPSTPEPGRGYVPQWEWGPITPDFLAVTPKPYAARPPVYADILDDETLEWAATAGVSPLISADTPTGEAVERLGRYRKLADDAGRRRCEVEAVLERRLTMDEDGDGTSLGGPPSALVEQIRDLVAEAAISHLVWCRGDGADDMFRFAAEVQPLLQA